MYRLSPHTQLLKIKMVAWKLFSESWKKKSLNPPVIIRIILVKFQNISFKIEKGVRCTRDCLITENQDDRLAAILFSNPENWQLIIRVATVIFQAICIAKRGGLRCTTKNLSDRRTDKRFATSDGRIKSKHVFRQMKNYFIKNL